MDFEPTQDALFAPFLPTVEAFAAHYGLRVSKVLDKDPVNPSACCFLLFANSECRGCYISVFTKDWQAASTGFRVVGHGQRHPRMWSYSVDEGPERLHELLESAREHALNS